MIIQSIAFQTKVLFLAGRLCFSIVGLNAQTKPGQKEKPNPAFVENPTWEFKLSDPVRSSFDFKVISPPHGAVVSGGFVLFEWRGSITKNLFLGIVNNKNKEVYYKPITGNKLNLGIAKLGFKPGLYYWFIESDKEMIDLGKFIYRPAKKKKG